MPRYTFGISATINLGSFSNVRPECRVEFDAEELPEELRQADPADQAKWVESFGRAWFGRIVDDMGLVDRFRRIIEEAMKEKGHGGRRGPQT